MASDIEIHPELSDDRHRHRRPVWVAVAAAAAVLLLVGVGFWLRSRPTPSTITVVGTGPAAASSVFAAPSWLPPGLKEWSVQSLTPRQAAAQNKKMRATYPGLPPFIGAVAPQPVELFGANGDTTHSILLSATPARDDTINSAHHRPLLVRGQHGAYQAISNGNGGYQTRITWHEGGTFTADLRGVRMRDAVALLNGLQWRTKTHADGFKAPASGRLRLLASTPRFTPFDPYISSVDFDLAERPMTFGTGLGQGRPVQLSISASSPSNFLTTWFNGHRRPDGTAESVIHASRSLGYILARLDGPTITVRAYGSPTITLADARHLVASLAPAERGTTQLALRVPPPDAPRPTSSESVVTHHSAGPRRPQWGSSSSAAPHMRGTRPSTPSTSSASCRPTATDAAATPPAATAAGPQ